MFLRPFAAAEYGTCGKPNDGSEAGRTEKLYERDGRYEAFDKARRLGGGSRVWRPTRRLGSMSSTT